MGRQGIACILSIRVDCSGSSDSRSKYKDDPTARRAIRTGSIVTITGTAAAAKEDTITGICANWQID